MATKRLLQSCDSYVTTINNICNNNKKELKEKDCYLGYSDNNDLIKIRVEGLITAVAFHKARLSAQKLSQHLSYKYAIPQIREMFQVDWYEYLQKMKVHIGGKMWILKRHVAVFINDSFIGSDIDFFDYLNELYVFHMPKNIEYYETQAKEYHKKFIESTKRIYVYFTFTLDGLTMGSLLFMLYSDLLPKTCKHFLNFCTGKYKNIKGFKVSHYVSTSVHRIVKNGWIQLGDIQLDNINLKTTVIPKIADESYCIPHDRRGILSMANNGKHSNESQIIVSLKPNPWMNYHYVAFGQLVDGIQTLQKIEDIPTYYESPIKEVIVSQCGEYIFDHKPKMEPETDIFLERQPWINVGENNIIHQYPYNTYSDISLWLDNIIDEIDIRDTASLLIAERYLSSLYCLSTDYLSEKSVNHFDKDQELDKNLNVNCKLKLRELLEDFQPETMCKEEKMIFIEKLSEIIVLYAFNFIHNEAA
ncbi:PREDICTED: peptidyl-prolyl cis-trans isomerase-like 6 [Polistes dominula]|uniref:Peptidyl-prolyl cis-trans isomerase-like 6 n=1 Tax=Polistes dominula TaxID=743375 RepID=A0ABM1J2E3_POLDO|nr:PREDICTED: peptidyl-prolyl cis-trans isomerase-like 6 [Polistes dominula]